MFRGLSIFKKSKHAKKTEIETTGADPSTNINKYVLEVMELTGKDKSAVEASMKKTRKEYDISYKEYVKNKLYLLESDSEVKQAANEIKHKKARKKRDEAAVSSVMELTGWDRTTTEARMKKVRKEHGISYKEYKKKKFYLLKSDDEIRQAAEALKERKAKKKLDKEEAINAAMNEMGWSREEAISNIEDARRRIGISYGQYRRYRMARLDPLAQKSEFSRRLESRKKRKEEVKQQRDDILKRTGWTSEQLDKEYDKVSKRIGCSKSEYWQLRLDQMTEAEQDTIFLQRQHVRLRKRYQADESMVKLMESKAGADEYFSEYIKRPWCINTEVDKDRFYELFSNESGIVYKPIYGLQARGVELFHFDEHPIEEVFETISSYPGGVLEGIVIQHPKMKELNPTSVNCLRIVSLSCSDKPITAEGIHTDIIGISVKIGGGGSVVDNLHAGGGVVAGVNLETGIIETDGVDWEGNVYKQHPVTGITLRGFKIPYFEEAKKFVFEMIEQKDLQGMIGWDIAIGESGPVLIEPNGKPDPAILSLPYSAEHKGLKKRMSKYIY